MEQDDIGGRVVLPVLQQIVAADVRAVAGRHERGQADPASTDRLERGETEGAGLGEEPGAPRRGKPVRQGGVQLHVRCGIHDAEAVRPDHPHAVGPRGGDEGPLGGDTGRAVLAETAAHHDEPLYPFLSALRDHLCHGRRRDRQDNQVDVVGNVADAGVCADARNVADIRVHRIHRTLETGPEQVDQYRVPHTARLAAGTDDGHRTGCE
jgi:hypothetical protein